MSGVPMALAPGRPTFLPSKKKEKDQVSIRINTMHTTKSGAGTQVSSLCLPTSRSYQQRRWQKTNGSQRRARQRNRVFGPGRQRGSWPVLFANVFVQREWHLLEGKEAIHARATKIPKIHEISNGLRVAPPPLTVPPLAHLKSLCIFCALGVPACVQRNHRQKVGGGGEETQRRPKRELA
nr:hypothetical protein [Pandoravirus massiliensis]